MSFEDREYEPAKAAAIQKRGPSNQVYHFIKGRGLSPKTANDGVWMENLVEDGVLVRFGEPEKEKDSAKTKGVTTDILPDYEPVEPPKTSKEGMKSSDDLIAEVAVAEADAKREEAAREKEIEEAQNEHPFYSFLKTLRGKNEDQMIEAINAKYFKRDLIAFCEEFDLDTDGNKADLAERLIGVFLQ